MEKDEYDFYQATQQKIMVLHDLVIDFDSYKVSRAGIEISLRRKEFQLLEFLVRNKNKVMNRHTILEYVWDYNNQTATNTLEVHMSGLRRKIDSKGKKQLFQTVYGAGYKISDQ